MRPRSFAAPERGFTLAEFIMTIFIGSVLLGAAWLLYADRTLTAQSQATSGAIRDLIRMADLAYSSKMEYLVRDDDGGSEMVSLGGLYVATGHLPEGITMTAANETPGPGPGKDPGKGMGGGSVPVPPGGPGPGGPAPRPIPPDSQFQNAWGGEFLVRAEQSDGVVYDLLTFELNNVPSKACTVIATSLAAHVYDTRVNGDLVGLLPAATNSDFGRSYLDAPQAIPLCMQSDRVSMVVRTLKTLNFSMMRYRPIVDVMTPEERAYIEPQYNRLMDAMEQRESDQVLLRLAAGGTIPEPIPGPGNPGPGKPIK